MMKRVILLASTLSLAACAGGGHINTDNSELSAARDAIAAAKAAGAERCAPDLQSDAVAAYYWAAHELTEKGYHPDENSELINRAISKANEAKAASARNCAPKPKPKPKPAPVEIIQLSGVNFANNSADLTPASMAILDDAVATLQRRADIHVEVAAHTSSRGADAYNMQLSIKRAASVKAYLVEHGIDAARLTSKGYGETQPIADNATAEGSAKNRRVELRVIN